jgi:chemotaxis protein MotC
MKPARRISAAAFAVLCLAGAVGTAASESDGAAELAPYQMVRSLQLLQDRIAAGDHAALPMQRKLLEMIDQRFRRTTSGDFVERRNYEALLVYAMSGGNPVTVEALLTKLHLEETTRSLGTGILGYLSGDVATARAVLEPVDPLTLTPELGAFFALVKGSVIASQDPQAALKMFDAARLLGPGSLVEEAALRRTMALAPQDVGAQRFLSAAGQYVRRFLRSPYASQFADALVAGTVALNDSIDLAELGLVIGGLDTEQQKVVYLRLARRAAIDGFPGLAQYAAGKADAIEIEGGDPSSDPRARLYAGLATITSETVDQVLPQLKAIDRALLSESDRRLLEAAEAIATEVTAQPDVPAAAAAPPNEPWSRRAPEAATPVDEGLPEAEPIDAASRPAAAAPGAKPTEGGSARLTAETDAHSSRTNAEASALETDPAGAIVEDARKKLDEIDKLLKDTAL